MRSSIIGAARQRYDLGETAAQAWRDFVDDAILADKLGFDALYTGEHHFCFASGNSSPLVLLTNIAARTERIRVGTSVICAPFHNPLRLANGSAAPGSVARAAERGYHLIASDATGTYERLCASAGPGRQQTAGVSAPNSGRHPPCVGNRQLPCRVLDSDYGPKPTKLPDSARRAPQPR